MRKLVSPAFEFRCGRYRFNGNDVEKCFCWFDYGHNMEHEDWYEACEDCYDAFELAELSLALGMSAEEAASVAFHILRDYLLRKEFPILYKMVQWLKDNYDYTAVDY